MPKVPQVSKHCNIYVMRNMRDKVNILTVDKHQSFL